MYDVNNLERRNFPKLTAMEQTQSMGDASSGLFLQWPLVLLQLAVHHVYTIDEIWMEDGGHFHHMDAAFKGHTDDIVSQVMGALRTVINQERGTHLISSVTPFGDSLKINKSCSFHSIGDFIENSG